MTLLKANPSLPFVLVCVLLDVIGFGLIIPVLPALVGEFTANPQEQALWYGALVAVYGMAQFFASPLLGALSDRFGRRPVLLLSQLGWGLDFLLIAFAPNLWVLALARCLGGITGAGFTVASAYVADVTTADKRTKGMGMIGAMFGIGFIVGPALGGVLGEYGVRVPFYAAAAVALLNMMYGYWVLPESHPADKRTAHGFTAIMRQSNPFISLRVLVQLPRSHTGVAVGALIVALSLSDLAQFVLHTSFVLYTTQRYAWGAMDNGIALFIVGLIHALIQGVLLGWLIKRVGDVRLAYIGAAFAVLNFVGLGLATQGWMVYAVIALTCLSAALHPALMGIISNNVPASDQGAVMGGITGLSAVMIVIAPMLASPILAATNHFPAHDWRFGSVYYLAAVLQLLSMGLVWRVLSRVNKHSA